MVARVNDLDFFVTNSEQEALILECNLIKRFRPHFNVRLKDDKTFPYLKIDLDQDWPRVHVTRHLEEDGGRYFGPFASARSVRQTLKVLKRIFPFRSCSRAITGSDLRPCLDYYIYLCLGPCIGAATKQEYAEVIKQVILFLEGKQERVVQGLESKMKKSAQALDFEKAALLRDQIQAIDRVIEGQRIATTVRGEQDVIAFATDKDRAYVQVFFTLLLLQHPLEDKTVIENWLQSRRGSRVHIQVPYRGNKKQLVKIVAENAEQGLQQLKVKQQAAPSALTAALAEIERMLRLPRPPTRIECYDISNIQGRAAVGSMVVFDKGKPKPSHYRRFRIKTVSGADDYAMLQEVLRRRFKRSSLKSSDASTPNTWAILPDLVLIDGGKGQLNAVRSVMQEVGVGFVPTASLAKEREEIFRRKAGVRSVEVRAGRMSVPLEAYCFKCQAKREMREPVPVVLRNGRPATKGICAVCGTKMFRFGSAG